MNNFEKLKHYIESLIVSIDANEDDKSFFSPILKSIEDLDSISINNYDKQKEKINFLVGEIVEFFDKFKSDNSTIPYMPPQQISKNADLLAKIRNIATNL